MAVVQVTVMFTDLVGSTGLSARLPAAEADELRHIHFRLLRDAVESSGGTEVKNLGDGIMAVFGLPSAALGCAVSLQQSVDARNRGAIPPLSVRVGISTGEATSEDGDYFGDPVVEAARLCASAEGGQILAAEIVRALAGRRTPCTFRPVGDLELKGLPDPLPTVEVVWEARPPARQVPLPVRLLTAPPVGLFGRAAELSRLGSVLKQVGAGEGCRTVLLSGDPGVGKTTLCAAFARTAHSEGAGVLYGRSEEDLGLPYQPFTEALSDFVAAAPEDLLAAHVARYGGELAGLVPTLADRLGSALPPPRGSDYEGQRHLLFASVVGLLATMGAERSVILVLDDLHWADPGTLLLLRHLVESPALAGLMIVGAFRKSDVVPGAALNDTLASLRRVEAVVRMELTGLGEADVAALLESGAGHPLGDEMSELPGQLQRETGGNPFFLLELTRHLIDGGWLFREDGRWRARPQLATLGMPESLREVVGQRVGRLSDPAGAVLTVGAVVGREFDVGLVAQIADVPEDAAVEACDRAVTARLLTDVAPGRYSFAHAVIQYTLAESLSPTRRAITHRRIAVALDAEDRGSGAHIGEVAHHWLAALSSADVDRAVDAARRAGEAALAALAPEEARRWFSSALEIGPDQTSRTDLLIGLGNAQRMAGDIGYRETLLEAARLAWAHGDRGRLVRSVLDNSRGILSGYFQVDREKLEAIEWALSVTSGDSPDRARLLALLAAESLFLGDRTTSTSLVADALAMARRVGDPVTSARVANMVYFCISTPDRHDDLLELTAEAVAWAEAQSDPAVRHWAHRLRLYSHLQDGDLAGIDEHLPEVVRYADAAGDPALRWGATFIRSWRVLLDGRLDDSERLARDAADLGEQTGQPEAALVLVLQVGEIRRHEGRFAEMEPAVAAIVEANPDYAVMASMLTLCRLQAGRESEAAESLQRASADGFSSVNSDLFWAYALATYAEVAAALGATKSAGVLYDRLRPWSDQVAQTSVCQLGSIALYTGMLAAVLGDVEAAGSELEKAVATNQRLGSAYWTARAQAELDRVRPPGTGWPG